MKMSGKIIEKSILCEFALTVELSLLEATRLIVFNPASRHTAAISAPTNPCVLAAISLIAFSDKECGIF